MSDYLEARKRVEDDLAFSEAKRFTYASPRVADLRAILNPPCPTVEDVARVIDALKDDDDERHSHVWNGALRDAKAAALALFTTPEGTEP